MADRDCNRCLHYKKVKGLERTWMCSKWRCEFEDKEKLIEQAEKLRKGIEELIDEYQDEINKLQEDRRQDRGVGFGDAILCGKIGAYGKAVADLKDLLEGVEECQK